MSICVISQPRLFPGLHYLHRMMLADIFVIFDTVQYNPRHEENRTKIKTAQGPQWLTVPMKRKSRNQLIQDTLIDQNQNWRKKFLKTLETIYHKTPYYAHHFQEIESIVNRPHQTLVELDTASWEPALRMLEIDCQFVYASELAATGSGSQLLLEICKQVDATTYISGGFGRDYLDLAAFKANNIEVDFHHYNYPVYKQKFGDFQPYLSYLDPLFNQGLSPELAMSGNSNWVTGEIYALASSHITA